MFVPQLIRLTERNKYNQPMGLFLCACGKEFESLVYSVKSGCTKSCGCFRRETSRRKAKEMAKNNTTHGLTGSGIYKSWEAMKQRCHNESCPDYKWYGGRGIQVCERWRSSFQDFYADMSESWWKGATLDRINNDGNYEYNNCQWLTIQDNAAKTHLKNKL